MLKWMKRELEWASVGHYWENSERKAARQYGSRLIWWDENDPPKVIGPQPDVPFWLYIITMHLPYQLLWWVKGLVCNYKGHDVTDNSFVGPETGYESYHCVRCGWSFEHTYY